MERDRKIVVIDDDLEVQALLGRCIEGMDLGIDVSYASSLTQAEEILKRDEVPPGLILLNLWLEEGSEETSGLMLLEKFRKDRRFENTPIIIVSADGREEIKDMCKKLGANGFVAKPFDLKDIEQEISKIFGVNT